jgi:hypothetical protein
MTHLGVLDAAFNVAHDFKPGGAAGLARAIDYNPITLSHEVKGQGGAKLGLATAVKITQRTGDLRILNAFAAECGAMVLLLPEALDIETSRAMQDLAAMAKEFGDVVQAAAKALEDNKVNQNELAEVRKQWSELVAVGQRMLAGIEACYEESKPAYLRAA